MFKKKSNEKNTYGIVGLGRFGHALALELAAAGAELVVLKNSLYSYGILFLRRACAG